MSDQLRRTLTLLETLLDYLPGPQMMRSAAADDAPAQGRSRTYTAAEMDRQIAHIEHMARMREGGPPRGEPWENARRDQYREGDYAALDAALARLEVVNVTHWRLAWRVATHHPGVLDRGLRIELVCSVRWLAVRLPEPVRVPTWTLASATPSVEHVAAMRELGVSMRTLARVYGPGVAAMRRKVNGRVVA